MIGQSQECDNYQQKLSRIQSSLFQQVNAPNLSLFNMFFLIQQVCATYPVTIDPNVEGSFDAKGWAMHGSWGFGKHLPNDRRFGLVICRENPLRISRKLLGSYDVQKQPHPGMTGQPKKKNLIQTITQLFCLEIHRTSLTLTNFVGAMAGGLEKVLYNVHDMNEKKPCTMIRGASSVTFPSRPMRFSDIR